MNLRSLVPLRDRGAPVRMDTMLLGPLDRLLEQFTQVAASGAGNIVPKIDVVETDKNIEITAELPGLEEGDVEISLVDNVLTIHGEKQAEQERDEQNYHITERVYGSFYRAIELPVGVDASQIQASMSNGVLKLVVPKPARSETQKITVTKGDGADAAKEAEKKEKRAA
ncbi:MAG: Hsp20/alpha crystallin family protein [Xanthobacteraceae bacterium]